MKVGGIRRTTKKKNDTVALLKSLAESKLALISPNVAKPFDSARTTNK